MLALNNSHFVEKPYAVNAEAIVDIRPSLIEAGAKGSGALEMNPETKEFDRDRKTTLIRVITGHEIHVIDDFDAVFDAWKGYSL
jgi:hypothetical protein